MMINFNNEDPSNKNQFNLENYNWMGVLEFLQDQYRQVTIKETDWLLEKQEMQDKLNRLEGELSAQENINKDLIKRIKMLEYCLRQERIKQNSGSENVNKDYLAQLVNNNENSMLGNPNISVANVVPKRSAKSQRPLLIKFLEEVGLDDIFTNLCDVSELNAFSKEIETKKEIIKTPVNDKNSFISNKNWGNFENNNNSFNQEPTEKEEKKSFIKEKKIEFSSENKDWEEKANLNSHFDSVRDVALFSSEKIVVSVSEDCMVKLWSLKNIEEQVEPYYTMREHTGPLFSIALLTKENKEKIAFTAGSEGLIKIWNIPSPDSIDAYGPSTKEELCLDTVNAHEEAIWDLICNERTNLLVSVAAEGAAKLWKYKEGLKELFSFNLDGKEIPTSAAFVGDYVAISYFENNVLGIFDRNNGNVVSSITYNSQSENFQINKLACHNNLNGLVLAACEDSYVRFFDVNSNKCIKNVLGHNDSVNGISLHNNNFYFGTVSHDGFTKVWDIRKYEVLWERAAHQKKYDESAQCIVFSSKNNMFLTGGADSVIKVFDSP